MIIIDHFTGWFAMVLSARLMKAWGPTFRRGVISRAQRHRYRMPLSTTTAGISHRCGATSLGCRATFCTGLRVLAVHSKPWHGILVLDRYSAVNSQVLRMVGLHEFSVVSAT